MIDSGTIDRIFEAAQIVDVVGEFVTLKKRGVNYMGNCPFHKEKTASFVVSPSKNIFKCFGCGKGGNAVHFMMEHEQMSYVEALKFLARKYHIEIQEKEQTPQEVQEKNERESMMIVSAFAQRVFSENLFTHKEGLAVGMSYFKERGFREDIIKKFELGYCLEERDAFSKRAIKEGFQKEYLVSCGLSIQNERGLYDRFWGRVMFPIHNLMGKVIAFGGRVLRTDKQSAKYVNSPESELYHKSQVLYGLFQAKKAILQEDKCYLVEGYTDVLSLHQSGIENVVASSGTALTVEQIRLIRRFTRNVTILYDGDAAGIKASLRGIDLVLEEGMQVKVILLPPGEDPDSFAKARSTVDLKEFLKIQETDFIRFKVKLLLEDAGRDPIKRANLINEILRSVAIIPDAIERSVFLRECAQMMDISETVINKECTRIRNKRLSVRDRDSRVYGGNEDHGNSLPEGDEGTFASDAFPDTLSTLPSNRMGQGEVLKGFETELTERELVRLMISYGSRPLSPDPVVSEKNVSVNEFVVRELRADELLFANPLYFRIFGEVEKGVTEGQPLKEHYFSRHPDPEISRLAATLLSTPYTLSKIHARTQSTIKMEEERLDELVPNALMAYKHKRVMMLINEVLSEIRLFESKESDAALEALQYRYMSLSQLKMVLGEKLGRRIIM